MTKRTRSTAVIEYNNKILSFEAYDPTSGRKYYFLPGGGIEAGESPAQSAVRETLEETGYKIRIDEKSELIKKYQFHWDGTDYDVVTYFYRGYLDEAFHEPGTIIDVPYNKGAVWLPVEEIDSIFSYTNEIRDAVNQLLQFSA